VAGLGGCGQIGFLGGLDVLVNNAGGLGNLQAAGASPLAVAVFDDLYQLNVRPAIVASNAAIEALLASKVLACPQIPNPNLNLQSRTHLQSGPDLWHHH